jgi:hypothetical protein
MIQKDHCTARVYPTCDIESRAMSAVSYYLHRNISTLEACVCVFGLSQPPTVCACPVILLKHNCSAMRPMTTTSLPF